MMTKKDKIPEYLLGTPKEEEKYIKISMDLAAQINAHLKELGWTQKDLAERLGKRESEISKWLSGTHNFTVRTLAKIESVTERDIFIIPLDIEERQQSKEIPDYKSWVSFSNVHQEQIISWQRMESKVYKRLEKTINEMIKESSSTNVVDRTMNINSNSLYARNFIVMDMEDLSLFPSNKQLEFDLISSNN